MRWEGLVATGGMRLQPLARQSLGPYLLTSHAAPSPWRLCACVSGGTAEGTPFANICAGAGKRRSQEGFTLFRATALMIYQLSL